MSSGSDNTPCYWTEALRFVTSGTTTTTTCRSAGLHGFTKDDLPPKGIAQSFQVGLEPRQQQSTATTTTGGDAAEGEKEKKGLMLMLPDAAGYSIEELGICVEPFTHSGFKGPLADFMAMQCWSRLQAVRFSVAGGDGDSDKKEAINVSTDGTKCINATDGTLRDLVEAYCALFSTAGPTDTLPSMPLTVTVKIRDITGLSRLFNANDTCDTPASDAFQCNESAAVGATLVCVEPPETFARSKEDQLVLGIATTSTTIGGTSGKKTSSPATGKKATSDPNNTVNDEADDFILANTRTESQYTFGRYIDASREIPIFQYSCDVCRARIPQVRYHCTQCEDYDLCPGCADSSKYLCEKGHRLSQEKLSVSDIKRKIMCTGGGLGYLSKITCELYEDRYFVGAKQDTLFSKPRFVKDGGQSEWTSSIDPHTAPYNYLRYGEVLAEASALAKSLHKRVLFDVPIPTEHADYNGDPIRVGLYMANSLEWVVVDIALTMLGCTVVPVNPGANMDTLQHILSVTDCHAVIADEHLLPNLLPCLSPCTRHVVVHRNIGEGLSAAVAESDENDNDSVPQPVSATAATVSGGDDSILPTAIIVAKSSTSTTKKTEQSTVSVHDIFELITAGKHDPMKVSVAMPTRKDDDIFTLIFTSGSTGNPKGAIQTHGIWAQCGFDKFLRSDPLVNVAYRPFSYATDRELIWRNFGNGGRVAIFTGKITELLDELVYIKPSSFSAPPRVWNGLFEKFTAELRKIMKVKKAELKEISIDLTDELNLKAVTATEREKLLRKYSRTLGSRSRMCGVGSAPVRPEVFKFLNDCFGEWGRMQVYESYGTTENGGITLNGYVYSDTRVILIDVPEMGFTTDSTPPQGEICVITTEAIPGYWRDQENTDKLFYVDDNGEKWIKTGDIGELSGGKLLIIDRRANLVKLATGTFISPEYLEGVFMNCPSVKDCFVHAEAHWEFPLAVVTYSDAALAAAAATANDGGDGKDQSSLLLPSCEDILKEMRQVAVEKDVAPNNIPHGVIIFNERFTADNGCLTISLKQSRPGLRKKFKAGLEALYNDLVSMGDDMRTDSMTMMNTDEEPQGSTDNIGLGSRQNSKVVENDFVTAEMSRASKLVIKVFQKVLHVRTVDTTCSAKELGADSISITMLRELLNEKCGVHFGVQTLWETPVETIIAEVAAAREASVRDGDGPYAGHNRRPSSKLPAATTTAANTNQIDSKKVEEFTKRITADSTFNVTDVDALAAGLENAKTEKGASPNCAIFLTGATGFIGHELLRQMLQSTPTTVIYCLVRSTTSLQDATNRLKMVAKNSSSTELIATALDNDRLRVVVGDLEGDNIFGENPSILGITDPNLLNELQENVTDVVHCGANVNHMLPYTALSKANVESLRGLLALFGTSPTSTSGAGSASHRKTFTFISTISVTNLTESQSTENESYAIAHLPEEVVASHLHGGRENPGGYALSKWAAERLLMSAASQGVVQLAGEEVTSSSSPVASIMRCGMTSWHSKFGHSNEPDWLCRLCKAVTMLKMYPAAPTHPTTVCEIAIAPVDWVASCIQSVIKYYAGAHNSAPNPNAGAGPCGVLHVVPVRTFDIVNVFKAVGASSVPVAQWRDALAKHASSTSTNGDDTERTSDTEQQEQSPADKETQKFFNSVNILFGKGLPASDRSINNNDGIEATMPPATAATFLSVASSFRGEESGTGSNSSSNLEDLLHPVDTPQEMVQGSVAQFAKWLSELTQQSNTS